MNKKHIAAIATVVVLVAAAAAVVLYMGEDQYTITYELNETTTRLIRPVTPPETRSSCTTHTMMSACSWPGTSMKG